MQPLRSFAKSSESCSLVKKVGRYYCHEVYFISAVRFLVANHYFETRKRSTLQLCFRMQKQPEVKRFDYLIFMPE